MERADDATAENTLPADVQQPKATTEPPMVEAATPAPAPTPTPEAAQPPTPGDASSDTTPQLPVAAVADPASAAPSVDEVRRRMTALYEEHKPSTSYGNPCPACVSLSVRVYLACRDCGAYNQTTQRVRAGMLCLGAHR